MSPVIVLSVSVNPRQHAPPNTTSSRPGRAGLWASANVATWRNIQSARNVVGFIRPAQPPPAADARPFGGFLQKDFEMTAFEKYINKLVKGEALDFDDGFPKNESSWEELFDFGVKRIGEIVFLKRNAAEQSVHLTALRRGLAVSILFNVVLLAVVAITIGGR
jgi:hypothetical protein